MRSFLRSRRAVVGLALTAWVLATFGPARPADEGPLRSEPLQWGLYQILWSRDYAAQLKAEAARFATPPAYVMFYRDLERPFPRFPIDCISEIGGTPMVSLELWSWHGGRKGPYLDAIIAGEYDEFLRGWAREAAADGRRVLLRFGFEFNGDWFTWSLDPPRFVAAWRRAHDLFQAEGATCVEWVWSPNVVSSPDTPDNDMHRYYPGDDYVDWVSLDGYNFGDEHDRWHRWESFEQIFAARLRDLHLRYPDKPVIISEMGCAPGTGDQRPRWIRQAHDTLMRFPRVKAVIWFNYDKRREHEPNWRIDVSAESLRAFNETFARPAAPPADPSEGRSVGPP